MSDATNSSLEKLCAVPVSARNEAWEREFMAAIPAAKFKVLSPDAQQGPDGWPYLFVSTAPEADEPAARILAWLSERGIGLAINPQKTTPDFVLTYGMVWNYRERGEFVSESNRSESRSSKIELKNGQEVLAGPPSESYLPSYSRAILRQFLVDQGVFAPKVLMVSFDKTNFDLCVSIESLRSPPESEHANIAEALAWFLPAHYAVSLISEKTIAGFQPL